jgi:hypothetical protein
MAFITMPSSSSFRETWREIKCFDNILRNESQSSGSLSRCCWSVIDIPVCYDNASEALKATAENELVVFKVAYLSCAQWLSGSLLSKLEVQENGHERHLSIQSGEGLVMLQILISLQIRELDWWF